MANKGQNKVWLMMAKKNGCRIERKDRFTKSRGDSQTAAPGRDNVVRFGYVGWPTEMASRENSKILSIVIDVEKLRSISKYNTHQADLNPEFGSMAELSTIIICMPSQEQDMFIFQSVESRVESQPKAEGAGQAITAIIASARPLLLSGMRQALGGGEGFDIVEVTDPDRLSLVIDDIRPDLLFADLSMAIANNFDTLRLVKAENLPCKLAVLVAEVDEEAIRLAADFSVDGVFPQTASAEEILAGLEEICRGQTVLPDEVRLALVELKSKRMVLGALSERELEVLGLAAAGQSNSQISSRLFITVNTVRFHLANIYHKLGVLNRTEAANYYLRHPFG